MTGAEPSTAGADAHGLDDPITPLDGALHVALISLQLQLLLLASLFVRCPPWMAPLAMLSMLLVVWYVTIPVEAVIAGVPGLIALLVLLRVRHTGRRRIWRRVQYVLLSVILVTMAVSTVVMLFGHGLDDCSL